MPITGRAEGMPTGPTTISTCVVCPTEGTITQDVSVPMLVPVLLAIVVSTATLSTVADEWLALALGCPDVTSRRETTRMRAGMEAPFIAFVSFLMG